MTQTQAPPRPSASSATPAAPRRRGRQIMVVLLVLSLVANFGIQTLGRAYHDKLIPRRTASHFSGFDSFTLGLLLGGLRGPLVMILWTNSENQKSEKNLENVNTQIELIRMLQADFMTVHVFQIWNKAYNLSVQMASLPNKYSTILDAIRYGQDVNKEIRDDINIMTSIAEVYLNKFGTSAERRYYIDRVRRETKHQANPPAVNPDPSAAPTVHPVLLDADGKILPEFLNPEKGLGGNGQYNGAELQFLGKYDQTGGFPDGVSPLALAYNYYKRAQMIMATTSQRHLQLSDSVIDSRPAIAARTWAEEEWGRGRLKEMIVFGIQPKDEIEKLDRITLAGLPANIPPKAQVKIDPAQAKQEIELALFAYQRCAEVSADAEAEYRRHITNPLYSSNAELYQSHIAIVQALALEAKADHDYLELAAAGSGVLPLPAGTTAEALHKKTIDEYQSAINAYNKVMVRYFVDLELANRTYPAITKRELGKAYQRSDIEEADPKVYPALILAIQKQDPNFSSDSEEFLNYVKVAKQRLEQLQKP